MKVGVLGGTFDPIHNAHIALGKAALRQLKLDRIAFVLSPWSPFKKKNELSPLLDRLAMVKRALRGQSGFFAAGWELKRRGPSYMVTTLAAYKRAHPAHRLFLILGSDAFGGFPRWKDPERILKLATVVVGRRPGALVGERRPGVLFLKGKFPSVSSTAVRARAAEKPRANLPVPPSVRAYILERKLYSPPHVR